MSLKVKDLFEFSGKTALVTGGSTGIGLMISSVLVSNGVHTTIVGRKQPALDAALAELRALGGAEVDAIQADLSRMDEVERLAEVYGQRQDKLNILVNNAGTSWGAPIEEFPEVAWDRVLNLNLKGVFFLTQKLIPLLSAAATDDDWGRVINLSSVGSRIAPLGASPAYGASKAGVEQLTRIMARELGRFRITCNAISPGWFPTRMNAVLGEAASDAWEANTPLGRLGTAADIGGLALFFASRAGIYVNGQTVEIDGGQTL